MRGRAWAERRWWVSARRDFGEEMVAMAGFLGRFSGLRGGTGIVETVVGVESL